MNMLLMTLSKYLPKREKKWVLYFKFYWPPDCFFTFFCTQSQAYKGQYKFFNTYKTILFHVFLVQQLFFRLHTDDMNNVKWHIENKKLSFNQYKNLYSKITILLYLQLIKLVSLIFFKTTYTSKVQTYHK